MQRNDVYTISSKTAYAEPDRLVISMLYQPILGNDATALYNLLWAEYELAKLHPSSIDYVDRLLRFLNMDSARLEKNLQILSALDLIVFYQKQGNDNNEYHFLLKAPIKAYAFINTPVLRNRLYLILGKRDFEKTISYFVNKKSDLSQYQNVSKKYKEVFQLSRTNLVSEKPIQNQFLKEDRAKIKGDLDFEALKIGLEAYNLDKILHNQIYKQHIEMVNTAYQVSIDQLVDSIVNAYHEQELSLKEFEEIVKNKSITNLTSNELKLVYYNPKSSQDIYGANSVVEFITHQFSHLKISTEVLNQLELVMKETKLAPAYMNVLIEYVIKRFGYLNMGWLKAVAKTIAQRNYASAYEAKAYLDSLVDKENKAKTQYKNNYVNNYKQKESIGHDGQLYQSEIKEASQEEVDKIKAMFAELEAK